MSDFKIGPNINFNFPFPFWGESFDLYEMVSGHVFVRFMQPVNEEQIKKIKALTPGDVQPQDSDFLGRMFHAKFFTDPHHYRTYDFSTYDFKGERYFSEVSDTEIEKWLIDVHSFCPIQFAYKDPLPYPNENCDVVRYSQWHTESVKIGKRFIEQLIKEKDTREQVPGEEGLFLFAFRGIYIESGINIRDFGIMLLQSKKSRNILFGLSAVVAILKDIIKAALLENNDPLLNLIQQEANNPENYSNIAIALSSIATEFMKKNDYATAIKLFDLALSIDNREGCKDLTLYCNALPALENSNNKFPINKELNNKFLAKCLPFAPKNPAIYFNASCLYMEMEEMDKAFDCIEELEKYQFKEYEYVINLIKTDLLFEPLRKSGRYKKLFFNKKN